MKIQANQKTRRGLFISFEGIDGSGKSVQAKKLYRNLIKMQYPAILIREPGGTIISEKIRNILLDHQNQNMTAITELFLYEASRAQLVQEIILPKISKRHVVITDRFVDSTVAYQSYGRQLPHAMTVEMSYQACAGLFPDRTYFLDISLDESQKRKVFAEKGDRLEQENRSFFKRVRKGYLYIAEKEPNRVLVLDGSKSMDILEQDILKDVLRCIKVFQIQKKGVVYESN